MEKREILPNDIWNEEKLKKVKKFVNKHSKEQSEERKLSNKLLSIQYKLEDYLEKEDVEENEILEILDFVKMYLKALDITKKDLAKYFDMQDSNLHKYLTGQRKLNPDIVLKISSFSHTKPEYWYGIQVKNEMIKLKNENKEDYSKYDYKNLVSV
ncbi:MAG: helix-turn-helix transcriptional regulator [Bacteroidota bacterium]